MENKADAHLSNALLLATVAIYVSVLAALFAGMVVAQPSAAAAVSLWAKDYGSFIAGIPVLVAVIIAKQQLDSNRAQHEAAVRIQFKDELDGLQIATEVALAHRRSWISSFFFHQKSDIRESDVEAVAKCKSPHVVDAFRLLKSIVNDGEKYPTKNLGPLDWIIQMHSALEDDETRAAEDVIRAVNARKTFLRQFSPDIQ